MILLNFFHLITCKNKKVIYICTHKTETLFEEWEISSVGSEHLPYKQGVGGSSPSSPTEMKALEKSKAFFDLNKMLLPYYQENTIEAGCDEAGRGCLAGPVVAAAVILPQDFTHEWLNDSKKLSEKKRKELRVIIEQEALAYAVSYVDHQKIDEINILNASFLAMHQAVDQLKLKPELLLIDGNRFKKHEIPNVCIIKGDGKYLSIAAASILAKTYRDDFMETLDIQFSNYNWRKNKGYPTNDHRKAIETHGFTPFHRKTFNVKASLQTKLEL